MDGIKHELTSAELSNLISGAVRKYVMPVVPDLVREAVAECLDNPPVLKCPFPTCGAQFDIGSYAQMIGLHFEAAHAHHMQKVD